MTQNNPIAYAKLAAKAADDRQAKNIVAYDVRNQNTIADIYMFMGATSHLHVRALEDAVREALKPTEAQLLRTDGQRGHLWRVLDYGSVLIHIMEEKTRDFYSVERLWEHGKKITLLKAEVAAPKKTPVAKKKPVAKKTAKKSSSKKNSSKKKSKR